MKKVLIFILVLLASLTTAFGAQFYDTYELSFSHETPDSVYVEGYECTNSGCTDWNTGSPVTIYQGDDAQVCIQNALNNGNVGQFNSCMSQAQVSNGLVDTTNNNLVVIRYDIPSSNGFLTYFSAEDDSYIVQFDRATNFVCNFDICFDSNFVDVDFNKKPNAIAEIQQFNVLNTNNPLYPVQVEVPVSLDTATCSAFQLTNPQWPLPNFPNGYSDINADTDINLKITNFNTGALYNEQNVQVSIPADQCTGVGFFDWTPSASLVNEEIKFRVETDVIDNQVSSSLIDFAEVVETVYPQTLTNNTCFVTTQDFTLSNTPSLSLNSAVTQIVEGEDLYALFTAGAFKGDTPDPINFRAELFLSGTKVYDAVLNSAPTLDTYTVNLSQYTTTPGNYPVELVTTPQHPDCDPIINDRQTLNLEILPIELYDVTFRVQDTNGNLLDGVAINFELQVPAGSYDVTQSTGFNGQTVFTDIGIGQYKYTATKTGFENVMNTVQIINDTLILITMNPDAPTNKAPVVNLPFEFVDFYFNDITFDVRSFVSDADNSFDELTITFQRTGNFDAIFNGTHFTLSANVPVNGTLTVTAQDPLGATGSDTAQVRFIDNNAPVIVQFDAIPNEGFAPLDVNFVVNVFDPEADMLTCTLDFGDNTSTTTTNCASLNGIGHNYPNPANYTATLTVSDGINPAVILTELIVVKKNETPTPDGVPVLNFFTLNSSNQTYVPTDLLLTWNITHTTNDIVNCRLAVNGVNISVACAGSYFIDNYDIAGAAEFIIKGTDSDGDEVVGVLTETFKRNNGPQVIKFDAIPNEGFAPLDVVFDVEVFDPEGDALSCILDFGDNTTALTNDCDALDGIGHNYPNPANYTAKLTVTDGINPAVMLTELIIVKKNDTVPPVVDGVPVINSFTVDANTTQLPSKVTISWNITHTTDYPMLCTLRVNGVNSTVPCVSSTMIDPYTLVGTGMFEIFAIDNISQEVTQKISKKFRLPQSTLNDLEFELIVDKYTPKGEFDFQLKVIGEDANRRDLFVRPVISCNGIENNLRTLPSGTLTHNGVSSVDRESTFTFQTDTADYELVVPTELDCTLKVYVSDGTGAEILLTAPICFIYEQEISRVSSIRGETTDVINYMHTALGGIERGYNTIDFSVDNRISDGKELEISVMSRELGISYSATEDLDALEVRPISIPLYVNPRIDDGMYPVRISVFDGDEKQVRYSYLKIEE